VTFENFFQGKLEEGDNCQAAQGVASVSNVSVCMRGVRACVRERERARASLGMCMLYVV